MARFDWHRNGSTGDPDWSLEVRSARAEQPLTKNPEVGIPEEGMVVLVEVGDGEQVVAVTSRFASSELVLDLAKECRGKPLEDLRRRVEDEERRLGARESLP